MQKVLNKKGKPSALSCVPYKRRKESEMIKIITEINSGLTHIAVNPKITRA